MSFDVRLGACKQHDQENMSKKLILVKPVEHGKRVERFELIIAIQLRDYSFEL